MKDDTCGNGGRPPTKVATRRRSQGGMLLTYSSLRERLRIIISNKEEQGHVVAGLRDELGIPESLLVHFNLLHSRRETPFLC